MDILVQVTSILPILSFFSLFFQLLFLLLDVNYKIYFFFIIDVKQYEQDLKKHMKIRQKREDGPHLNQHVHLDREEYEEFLFYFILFYFFLFYFIFFYIIIWTF